LPNLFHEEEVGFMEATLLLAVGEKFVVISVIVVQLEMGVPA
jgi:hypothetical protein